MLFRSTALGWNWSYLYSQFNWSFLEQTCPFIISKNFYLYKEKNEQNYYNQPAQLPFAHSEKLKTAGKFTTVHTSSTIALSKLLYFWMTACPMLSSMKLKQEKKSVDWKIQPLTRAAFKLNLSFSFVFLKLKAVLTRKVQFTYLCQYVICKENITDIMLGMKLTYDQYQTCNFIKLTESNDVTWVTTNKTRVEIKWCFTPRQSDDTHNMISSLTSHHTARYEIWKKGYGIQHQ